MLQEFEKNNIALSLQYLKKEGKNVLTLGRLEYMLGNVSESHDRDERVNLSFTLKTPKLDFIFGITGLEFTSADKIGILRLYKGEPGLQNEKLKKYDSSSFDFTTILKEIAISYDRLVDSSKSQFDFMNRMRDANSKKIKSIVFPDYHKPETYASISSLQSDIDRAKNICDSIPGLNWEVVPCTIESTFFPTGFVMIEKATSFKDIQEKVSSYIGASFVCDSFNPEKEDLNVLLSS